VQNYADLLIGVGFLNVARGIAFAQDRVTDLWQAFPNDI
jgi:hypothetical protein